MSSLLINFNISVFGITETELDSTVSNEEAKIDGYNLIRFDRSRDGAGIACYIKRDISFNHCESLSENFSVNIKLPKWKLGHLL